MQPLVVDVLPGEVHLAGERAASGTYVQVDSGRWVHLAEEGYLPASMDGHVACYVRMDHAWGRHMSARSRGGVAWRAAEGR
jgi:hypothetical protein